jgi:SAM-dependent methyltransferase
MKNQAEIERWNGVVGDRWAEHQEALDARLDIYGKDLLTKADLADGMRVLDVGCGCASLTIGAARAVGAAGRVVGLDISRPMLARAQARVKELPNVALVEHDAATFSPDAPFDVVISRFGVMFFDDPAAAFTNVRSATKKGGRLAFACWQPLEKNPWAGVPMSALLRVVPPLPPAPPDAPGPFALAAPDRVRELLARAGWSDVAITPSAHPMTLGATLEEAVEYSSRMGPAARLLQDIDEATTARALEMVRQTLAPLAPGFALDGGVWLVTARA